MIDLKIFKRNIKRLKVKKSRGTTPANHKTKNKH